MDKKGKRSKRAVTVSPFNNQPNQIIVSTLLFGPLGRDRMVFALAQLQHCGRADILRCLDSGVFDLVEPTDHIDKIVPPPLL